MKSKNMLIGVFLIAIAACTNSFVHFTGSWFLTLLFLLAGGIAFGISLPNTSHKK